MTRTCVAVDTSVLAATIGIDRAVEGDVGTNVALHLPEKLRFALQSAVEQGDMDQFNRLVGQVASIDDQLESNLATLASRYDYAALLDLLVDGDGTGGKGKDGE